MVRWDPGAGPEFGGRFQQAIAHRRVGRELSDGGGAGHSESVAHGNEDRHDDRRDDRYEDRYDRGGYSSGGGLFTTGNRDRAAERDRRDAGRRESGRGRRGDDAPDLPGFL